jgi:aminoglycoside 6'-N-acetyltransferase
MNKPIPITLRPATIDDLTILKYWDEQPHVVDSDPKDDWNWEKELLNEPEWRRQLMAELNGRPVGFIQIIDPAKEETHYWGDVADNLRAIDIWIGEEEDLGKGYGTIMMTLALNSCFAEENVASVIIDPLASNTKAIRFYERIGFQYVAHRYFGEDLCCVYKMDKNEWLNKQAKQP